MDDTKVIRFSDLAIEERLKLTDEEVNGFTDLECAFEGLNKEGRQRIVNNNVY